MKQNNFTQQTHFIGVLLPEDLTLTLQDCRRYMKSENVTLNEMADILETIGQQEKEIFTRIDSEFLKSSSALKYA